MAGASGHTPVFLVVRLSSFGDVVLTEPVARSLKKAFAGCRVVFATYDQYSGLPKLMNCVDQVVPVGRVGGIPLDGSALAGIGFDAAIDLQNNLRSRSLVRRAGARRVLRYRRQYLRRLLCVYAPWIWKGNLRHTVDLYLDSVRPLGISREPVVPALNVPSGLARGLREQVGGKRLVGVCPGTSSPHKTWGRARFAGLARQLRARGYRVLVIGSGADRAEVAAVSADAADSGVTAHVTDDVTAIAALLSACDAAVSNDSGLMHLAAAVGCKAVGIFGPTSPALGFSPLGPGCRAVSRNARCSPCSYHGNRPCRFGRPFCLEEIDPGEVASIVDGVTGRETEG